MKIPGIVAASSAIALCLFASNQARAGSCENLTGLRLHQATVTAATSVPAGSFTPPPLPGVTTPSTPIPDLPAFCRVQITSTPTSDSQIGIEVWLPEAWNGKYMQVGNGGFAGTIPYSDLGVAIQRGYAAAGTDDGHVSPNPTDASWALGHPQKIIDFGYRALKETTDSAKAVIAAFAGDAPQYSYFFGCSDGGREALMESQRYPDDFDGIVVGDPANLWIPLLTQAVWSSQALLETPESYIPPAKLPAITNAAVAACDGLDGVLDGVINKPRQCRFNPAQLLCTDGDNDNCLTAPQVAALRKIYAGPHTSDGQPINSRFLPGAEAYSDPAVPFGWIGWITGPGPDASSITNALAYQFGSNFYKYMVFNDPNWDLRTLNFDTDVEKALTTPVAGQALGDVLQAADPDLSEFRAHGGKMIQFHGTTDYAVPPGTSIKYYRAVQAFFDTYDRRGSNRDIDDFYRLFMVPGMQHCYVGPGANVFGQKVPGPDADHDVVKALEAWVEHGKAPARIIATKYPEDDSTQPAAFTRPLCPYPTMAAWNHKGDASDAANWSCR